MVTAARAIPSSLATRVQDHWGRGCFADGSEFAAACSRPHGSALSPRQYMGLWGMCWQHPFLQSVSNKESRNHLREKL